MTIDSTFMHLARGNRVKTYLGVKGEYSHGRNYQYLESKIAPEGKKKNYKAGDTVFLSPQMTVAPKSTTLLVSVNPELLKYGKVSYLSMVEAGDPGDLKVRVDLDTDMNIDEIPWLVRVYATN